MSDDQLPASSQMVSVMRADDPAGVSEETEAVNPLLRLHVLLHGRYRYAIVLGLLLSACGAVAGYWFTPPKYEIVGYIRVRPYIPKILYATDQNGVLPSFETYVNFQESLIQSQRVMDRAAQNPAWVALHRKPAADGTDQVSTDNLVVDHEKGTELITVTATDRDLNVAMAAVKSIIKAYTDINGETDNEGDAHRLQALEDLRTSLSNQERGLRDQILQLANENGTDDLTQLHDLKAEQASKLESELESTALAIAQASPDQQPVATTGPATKPTQLTPEDVAVVDQRMTRFLTQKDQLTVKIFELRTKLGENSQEVREAVGEQALLNQQIDALVAVYQARGFVPGGAAGRDRSRMSLADLRAEQKDVSALYEKVHNEAVELGRKDLQIRTLKTDDEKLTQRLNAASAQIDQLTLEGGPLASRISVLSDGEKPTTPPKSKRLPMTAAGGVGGMCLGVGLIALWGLGDRRVRSVLQVQQLQPTVRMLGVLPILPEELSSPEQKAMAAHCVHQIRTLLDTGDHSTGRVLAITSPSAADGKTSLTLALGLSFAGAGYRTLMIDSDIVGGGLTGRLHAIARQGVGPTLCKKGLLTKAQLKEAQAICASTHRELPEVLLELGFATQEDIRRADAERDETSVGLLDALDGEPVSACVTSVLAKGLFVLPLGDATAEHNSQVSPKAFRRILAEARQVFDVVIVDTGPILGSLEASIVVREADEVVLTVANYGSSPLVKRALTLLDSLGVGLAGLVFNRANRADVAFANYGSSSSHKSIRSINSRERQSWNSSTLPRLGSLAAAVVGTSASSGEAKGETAGAVNGTLSGEVNGAVDGASSGTANGASNGASSGTVNGAVNGVPGEGNGHDGAD
jgi:succinoglycan biosynthesis transport protein ExoP